MSEEQLIATLQACYFGDRGAFNKILKEYKQLQQELTKYKERNENAIEYINFLTIFKSKIEMIKFNETIWGKELLEILEDKENENEINNR